MTLLDPAPVNDIDFFGSGQTLLMLPLKFGSINFIQSFCWWLWWCTGGVRGFQSRWFPEFQWTFNFAQLKLYSGLQWIKGGINVIKVVVNGNIHRPGSRVSGGVGMSRCRWDLEPQSRFRGSGHPTGTHLSAFAALVLIWTTLRKSWFHFSDL